MGHLDGGQNAWDLGRWGYEMEEDESGLESGRVFTDQTFEQEGEVIEVFHFEH